MRLIANLHQMFAICIDMANYFVAIAKRVLIDLTFLDVHSSFPFLELLAVVLLATLHLATTLAECEILLEFFALFLKDTAVDFLILFHCC